MHRTFGLSSYQMNFLGSPARMELNSLNMSLQLQRYAKNLIHKTNDNIFAFVFCCLLLKHRKKCGATTYLSW